MQIAGHPCLTGCAMTSATGKQIKPRGVARSSRQKTNSARLNLLRLIQSRAAHKYGNLAFHNLFLGFPAPPALDLRYIFIHKHVLAIFYQYNHFFRNKYESVPTVITRCVYFNSFLFLAHVIHHRFYFYLWLRPSLEII